MDRLFREVPYAGQMPSDKMLAELAPLQAVPGCGGIVVHQTEYFFALWEAWETETGRQCSTPFWAIAWPAAIVLARHLLQNPVLVKGKTVLDIGCGGGVACIATALGGAARVIANDIDPAALIIAQRNFTANNVAVETTNRDLTVGQNDNPADLILVADLFYNRSSSETLLAYLHHSRQKGSMVLIADSNRPFTPSTGITVLSQETVPVSVEIEGVSHRDVKIIAFSEMHA